MSTARARAARPVPRQVSFSPGSIRKSRVPVALHPSRSLKSVRSRNSSSRPRSAATLQPPGQVSPSTDQAVLSRYCERACGPPIRRATVFSNLPLEHRFAWKHFAFSAKRASRASDALRDRHSICKLRRPWLRPICQAFVTRNWSPEERYRCSCRHRIQVPSRRSFGRRLGRTVCVLRACVLWPFAPRCGHTARHLKGV